MKRSELNALIRDALAFADACHWALPPFARFTPQDWAQADDAYREIWDNMLGWDVTDFGHGDFAKCGLLLFTMRNGHPTDRMTYPKTYAEKMMIIGEGQITPYHYHWNKMEDIINRGAGVLTVKLYNATQDDKLDQVSPVTVHVDGRAYQMEAGGLVQLHPGQSITLMPRQYHSFWAEVGMGRVLAGEVSMVNDDISDNRFADPGDRFQAIEEDVPPAFLLAQDYAHLRKG